jgi:hypothetical protein
MGDRPAGGISCRPRRVGRWCRRRLFGDRRDARLRDRARGGRGPGHGQMHAQPADHLAADALDPDQLVDRAKGTSLSIDEDGLRLGRADSGQQGQDLGGGGVEVHHPVHRLASVRGRRSRQEKESWEDQATDRGAGTHACLSVRGRIRLFAIVTGAPGSRRRSGCKASPRAPCSPRFRWGGRCIPPDSRCCSRTPWRRIASRRTSGRTGPRRGRSRPPCSRSSVRLGRRRPESPVRLPLGR